MGNDKIHIFLFFFLPRSLRSSDRASERSPDPPCNFRFRTQARARAHGRSRGTAYLIIPRELLLLLFLRLGIDGIINKHHTNYPTTVLLIFSPRRRRYNIHLGPARSPTRQLIIPRTQACVSTRFFPQPPPPPPPPPHVSPQTARIYTFSR